MYQRHYIDRHYIEAYLIIQDPENTPSTSPTSS